MVGIVEIVLVLLLAGLGVLTVWVIVDPSLTFAVVNSQLDVTFITISTLVSTFLALELWGRYREGEGFAALLRAAAFAVLSVMSLAILTITVSGGAEALGMSLASPGQLPVLVGALGRGTATVLLVLAGAVALDGRAWRVRYGALVVILPAAGMLALMVLAAASQDALPQLITPDGLAQLRAEPTELFFTAAVTPGLVIVQALIGAGHFVAAGLSYVLYRRDGRPSEALLSIGFAIGAFSQVHAALHPGAYAGLVTTGDVLRVAFYAMLFAAVVVASRDDVRALRLAHADLQRLRDTELAGAALEERARLAREIHDGLAQDLWYAKLKQGRLIQQLHGASAPEAAAEPRTLADEVAEAIDSALSETRQAVMALRPQPYAGSLVEVITRYLDDFGDRFALRTELRADADLPTLPARTQAELLRILQEALNNARKHADPTVIRVTVTVHGTIVRLEIADNGRGFDPASVPPDRYGLASMRERAQLIGGVFGIDAQAQDGTRISVEVPVREEVR